MILLDMDGLIADFHWEVCQAHDVDESVLVDWEFQFDWTKKCNGHNFWLGLRKTPWADDLYSELVKLDMVVFCSSPGQDVESSSAKRQWLIEHGFLLDKHDSRFCFTSWKWMLASPGKILLDDSEQQVDDFEGNGGKAVLFPRQWNRNRHLTEDKIEWTLDQLECLLR